MFVILYVESDYEGDNTYVIGVTPMDPQWIVDKYNKRLDEEYPKRPLAGEFRVVGKVPDLSRHAREDWENIMLGDLERWKEPV